MLVTRFISHNRVMWYTYLHMLYPMDECWTLESWNILHDREQTFLKGIAAPLFDSGHNFKDPGNDDNVLVNMHVEVINAACGAGYEPCLKEARKLYRSWLSKDQQERACPLSPNYRDLVFRYGMTNATGSGESWRVLFDRYAAEQDAQEKEAYLRALARTPSVDQLKE